MATDKKQTPIKPEEVENIHSHLMEYLVERRPYFIKLEEQVQKVDNGIITVELRVKDGFVTDLLTTEVKRHTFKPTENKSNS